jgi:hypothetical protein
MILVATCGLGIFAKQPLYIFHTTSGLCYCLTNTGPTCQPGRGGIKINYSLDAEGFELRTC